MKIGLLVTPPEGLTADAVLADLDRRLRAGGYSQVTITFDGSVPQNARAAARADGQERRSRG